MVNVSLPITIVLSTNVPLRPVDVKIVYVSPVTPVNPAARLRSSVAPLSEAVPPMPNTS